MDMVGCTGPRQHALQPGKATYFPTKFSSTELFPALWPPTTAIWGRSRFAFCPMAEKASCMRFTRGIKSSIPRFPIFAMHWAVYLPCQSRDGCISYLSLLATLAFRGRFGLRAHTGFTCRFAPSLSAPPRCVRSPQQLGLSPQPSVCSPLHRAPQEGEDEDDRLYFLRRDPCSSPRTPLGGDTGVLSPCCLSKLWCL